MSRVIHFEIHSSQPQVLIEFYRQVFDWQITQWDEMDYWLVSTGPESEPGINGAILPRPVCAQADAQVVNAFVCTIAVESIDEALAKSLALGAVLQLPKSAVPAVGYVAYIKDPDGNLLCILEPDMTLG